jgi:tRNA (adenine22-N1)-methyltransferase
VQKRPSKRIHELIKIISNDTQYLYDLCCDHGEIGLAAAKRYPSLKITLVDTVETIVEKLVPKVTDIPAFCNVSIQKKDCRIANFKFHQKTQFILAGIGGILAVEILSNLLKRESESQVGGEAQYICCIHQNLENFKEFLKAKTDLVVKSKVIICDNKQFYEIFLLVHRNDSESILKEIEIFSLEDFDKNNQEHLEYLKTLTKYYQIKSLHNDDSKFDEYYEKLVFINKSMALPNT